MPESKVASKISSKIADAADSTVAESVAEVVSAPIVLDPEMERMFKAGAHFAFAKNRRHPSVKPLIFGVKNKVEIFDLEKTREYLAKAKEYMKKLGAAGSTVLFVSGKSEAREAIERAGRVLGMPFVAGRWIGGTFTNFGQIRKRIDRMEKLVSDREKGELLKYTKKERLMIDREIANLQRFFGGIAIMKELPKAIFVIDSKKEKTAVAEAHSVRVPIVALCGSDCDLTDVTQPIPGNDTSVASINFFVNEIVAAYQEGKATIK
jgi:small subunit ribosomal protein S2